MLQKNLVNIKDRIRIWNAHIHFVFIRIIAIPYQYNLQLFYNLTGMLKLCSKYDNRYIFKFNMIEYRYDIGII